MPIPGQPNPGTLSSTATLAKPQHWRPVPGAGGMRQVTLYEAASQTFDYGEIISLDTSGNVTNMGALSDPAANAVSSAMSTASATSPSTLCYGIALQPASNLSAISTTRNIPVLILDNNIEVFLRVYNSTGTSCEVQDVAIGTAYEPRRYGGANISTTVRDCQTVIAVPANGTDLINKFILMEIPNEYALTDTYAGMWFKVRFATGGIL